MPIYSPSPSRKINGFSIDNLIQHDHRSTLPHVPSSSWLLPLANTYQLHLQYLRHFHQLTHSGVAAALLLNSYRKPKRNRTAFTPSQLLKLESAFEKNHYIVGQERKELARHLNLPEARVKVWYQNRRTKHKRLIPEDGDSSVNELDQQNESDMSDSIIKNDDERSWNTEENDSHLELAQGQDQACTNL